MTKRRWFFPVVIAGGLALPALLVLAFIVLGRAAFSPTPSPTSALWEVATALAIPPPP
jgi:hypothetical protein